MRMSHSARFMIGCVLADAGYGLSAPFRQGLTARKLAWAVAVTHNARALPQNHACRN